MADRLTRRKAKHAKAQRSYAARRRQEGIPSFDQLARAVLAALREIVNRNSFAAAQRAKIARPVIHLAVDQLVARGFDRQQAHERLVRALFPEDASR